MKTAVITGASSGMGREFVRQVGYFYRNLDEIWVIARRKDRLERLAETSPVPVRIFDGDLGKKAVFRDIGSALEKEKPDIRMLVNAAGFGKIGTVEKIAAEDLKIQAEMIDINCRALTKMTLLCLPYMSAGSRIINLASAAAFCPQVSFAVYAATKAYVLSFSRGLGAEVRKKGIFVTAVCPGPVDTEFFSVSGNLNNPWKKLVMEKAPGVVTRALKDSRKRKSISVCGFPMKAAYAGTKLIPHGFILKMEEKLSG